MMNVLLNGPSVAVFREWQVFPFCAFSFHLKSQDKTWERCFNSTFVIK